ncbi:hypothetical protein C5167_037848 [Papaver somniferum]|uniref:peptidylprolyl isomerase n=1 Tax=Papaver somniferum TaxID=3469 RepID=A0A4Y7IBM0_PAPSO|nr:hypothetical protein C5167_037848 [Papaver somniferum]
MMRRDISHYLQPRFLLIFLVAIILVFLAFPNFQREEDKAEEVHEITHRVFLDVDIGEQRIGRLVIGLYGQVVPKTVGEMGTGANGKELHYKGVPFHRIISGFVVQGGDIAHGDGKGAESIYGGTFPDENFKVIQGMDTVYAIEGGAGTYNGKPRKKVVIADSGEIPMSKWDEET